MSSTDAKEQTGRYRRFPNTRATMVVMMRGNWVSSPLSLTEVKIWSRHVHHGLQHFFKKEVKIPSGVVSRCDYLKFPLRLLVLSVSRSQNWVGEGRTLSSSAFSPLCSLSLSLSLSRSDSSSALPIITGLQKRKRKKSPCPPLLFPFPERLPLLRSALSPGSLSGSPSHLPLGSD